MSAAARNTTEGHTFSGKPKTVTIERMRGFSGWPVKNIHTDVEYAKACGLAGPIASGTMFQTYLVGLMIGYFGADWLGNGGIQVAFVRAVEPGDVITPMGTVEKQEPTDAGNRVELRVWCENQRGEPVVVGTAFGLAR